MKWLILMILLSGVGMSWLVFNIFLIPPPPPPQSTPGLAPGLTFAPPPQPVRPPWIPIPRVYGPWWTNFNFGQIQYYDYLDDAVNGLAFCLANSPVPGYVPKDFPNPITINNLANDLTPGSGTTLWGASLNPYWIYKMQRPRPN